MMRLLSLIGLITPRAFASAIEQLGSGSPGIDNMWAELKGLFPHTDLGSGGIAYFVLLITNLILRFIAGAAVLMVVYGGIKMITTVADENAQAEAKKVIMFAAIGLILAMGADAIVMYVIAVVASGTGGA